MQNTGADHSYFLFKKRFLSLWFILVSYFMIYIREDINKLTSWCSSGKRFLRAFA